MKFSTVIAFVLLVLPTVWELWDDRNGETPKEKRLDVYGRASFMVSAAIGNNWIVGFSVINFISALFLSFAIFFLTFDYAINLILGRKPWYTYLSKSPLDKLWSSWDWRLRMAIRVAVFIISLTIFLWN